MAMSYTKFIMYMATIPNFETDKKNTAEKQKETGSINLFDLDTR